MEKNRQELDPAVAMTDFFTLEDGSIGELIENPDNSQETTFAVCNHGVVRYKKTLTADSRIMAPYRRDDGIMKHVRLARGAQPYGSARELYSRASAMLRACLDLDEDSLSLLAFFALSTWFVDRLPIAPYLALVGRAGSGKTTALRALNLLCRRSLLTSDITSAALYKACQNLAPTLLIDETATAGDTRILFHLLRSGSTPDFVALRRVETFRCFGPKVVSWTELPDDIALNTRCVIVPMRESHRNDLLRPNDPQIVQAADNLQKSLLQFRLEMHSKLGAPPVPERKRWYARNRDLFQALALPVSMDSELLAALASAFEGQELLTREGLSSRQSTVFDLLAVCVHWAPTPRATIPIKVLAQWTNSVLSAIGEKFQMSEREVGAVLLSLGVGNRKRTNAGWVVLIDQKLSEYVHDFAASHGVDIAAFRPKSAERCELCDRLASEGTEEKVSQNASSPAVKRMAMRREHRRVYGVKHSA
ncbi:MAG: hypothetical protein WAM96_09100 [Candidatus Acidiferrales bacterium]